MLRGRHVVINTAEKKRDMTASVAVRPPFGACAPDSAAEVLVA